MAETIGKADSGTGKIATFSIGALQRIDYSLRQCQALILAATRELAQQVHQVVQALGDYLALRCHCCVGGMATHEDVAGPALCYRHSWPRHGHDV